MTGVVPPGLLTGIDHTLVGVRDLEAARRTWQQLGFTLTPRGRHIGWGTGNYCIMFESGYIELLGVVDRGQFLNNLDRFLERRQGLMGLAFGTDKAPACAAALKDAGLVPDGPKHLARKLELPEGDVEPAFHLIFLKPEDTPGVKSFICHQRTPELIRRPEWQRHANRATKLISVTIVCTDPVAAALGYLPLFGPDRVKVSDSLTVVDCASSNAANGGGALRFVTPAGLQLLYADIAPLPSNALPWVAAMKIEVADRQRCEDFLRDQNLPVVRTWKRCLVPPELANGCIIEFVEKS